MSSNSFGTTDVAVASLVLAVIVAAGPGPQGAAPKAAGSAPMRAIERADPRLDRLIPPAATVEVVTSGHTWVEGPVWDTARGCLYFSDIPRNAVYQWRQGTGTRLFLESASYSGTTPFAGREPGSNGLTLDTQGRLVLCEHGNRRITRLEADGTRTVLAEHFDGRRLNSPNDAVFGPDGSLYFTDPPFGLPQAFGDQARELPYCGVYRLRPDGELTLLTRDVKAPNGIALSPDGGTLYVSNADRSDPVWLALPISTGGALGPGRVFASAAPWVASRPGGPDGIKVDEEGNVFAVGPGGVYVYDPTGIHLGTILIGTATSNCAWGDDGSVLYITAGTSVYRVRTATRGLRHVGRS